MECSWKCIQLATSQMNCESESWSIYNGIPCTKNYLCSLLHFCIYYPFREKNITKKQLQRSALKCTSVVFQLQKSLCILFEWISVHREQENEKNPKSRALEHHCYVVCIHLIIPFICWSIICCYTLKGNRNQTRTPTSKQENNKKAEEHRKATMEMNQKGIDHKNKIPLLFAISFELACINQRTREQHKNLNWRRINSNEGRHQKK